MKIESQLSSPPDYEYESVGPWFVTQQWKGRKPKVWLVEDLRFAVGMFWGHDRKTHPQRRVLVDSAGVTILGINRADGAAPLMVATREVMQLAVELSGVPAVGATMDQRIDVITGDEVLRSMGGVMP